MSIGDRLEKLALRLDRRPILIVTLLAAIYVVLIAPSVHRHLWYDELHTFYIAQATSVRQFVDEIGLLDLNPPLTYLLTRASMDVLGPTELGARLPVIVGFFLGSIGMFVFMARRVGALWAAAGVGLLWYNQSFYYATEARPYGVLLGFLGLMLVSWDYAADPATPSSRRRWSLAGVAVGAAGMLLSHAYALFWVMPFWAAELVRDWKQRRMDWPLWAAMVLPMAACLTYFPFLQTAGQAVFPASLLGSVGNAVWFYVRTFYPIAPSVIVGGGIAIGIAAWRRRASTTGPDTVEATGMAARDLTLLVFALLPPVLLNVLTSYMHIPFYDRHAFLTRFTADLLVLLFIAYECRANRLSGLAAAIVMLGFTVFVPADSLKSIYASSANTSFSPAPKDFDRIHPELPFVDNSVLTYLEMDHYEKPEFLARLYYLVDPESAIKYAGSNLTEGLPLLKRYFPIRANVSSCADFVATHRHFLVWGEEQDQRGWLLTKLKAEGAQVTEIGHFDSPYPDSQLYEVRLDP